MGANVRAGDKGSRTWLQATVDWWFQPIPRGRIAALRSIIYLFIFVDVLITTAWVSDHAAVPGELYGPLLLGRILPLPVPTETLVYLIKYSLLACSAIAATNKLPRLAGSAVFLLYFEWMFIAMSYGKVDHDRFAFLVALAVLPTAGAARWGDRTADEKAGWAVRCIQVAVVLTYFLSVVAKLRFGGPEWLTSTTFTRAVIRRGTWIVEPLLGVPWLLQLAQWGIFAFELASPLLLVPGKIGRRFLIAALVFHLVTFSTITIIFLPHMICLFSFVQLERIDPTKIRERITQKWRAPRAAV